jgi:hypothetical protein
MNLFITLLENVNKSRTSATNVSLILHEVGLQLFCSTQRWTCRLQHFQFADLVIVDFAMYNLTMQKKQQKTTTKKTTKPTL